MRAQREPLQRCLEKYNRYLPVDAVALPAGAQAVDTRRGMAQRMISTAIHFRRCIRPAACKAQLVGGQGYIPSAVIMISVDPEGREIEVPSSLTV